MRLKICFVFLSRFMQLLSLPLINVVGNSCLTGRRTTKGTLLLISLNGLYVNAGVLDYKEYREEARQLRRTVLELKNQAKNIEASHKETVKALNKTIKQQGNQIAELRVLKFTDKERAQMEEEKDLNSLEDLGAPKMSFLLFSAVLGSNLMVILFLLRKKVYSTKLLEEGR